MTSCPWYLHTKGLGTAGGGVAGFTPTETPNILRFTRWGIAAIVKPT